MNYRRILRAIRVHPALYGDLGSAKEAQALRIRDKCKARLAPVFKAQAEHAEWLRGQRILRMYA